MSDEPGLEAIRQKLDEIVDEADAGWLPVMLMELRTRLGESPEAWRGCWELGTLLHDMLKVMANPDMTLTNHKTAVAGLQMLVMGVMTMHEMEHLAR